MANVNWLRWITLLVSINAVFVGWSIVQRHLLATDPPPSAQEQLQQLVSPELSQQPAQPVAANDPLLNQIRQIVDQQYAESEVLDDSVQAESAEADSEQANSAQEVSIPVDSTEAGLQLPSDLPSPSNPSPGIPNPSNIVLLKSRLRVIGSLNQAAQQLADLAALQQQLAQPEQADVTLARCQQLQQLQIELLSD